MAERVLSNIIEGILNSLDGPLAAIDGLKNLREMVSAIKPELLRAEEQLAPNDAVDCWLGKLNDVIYKADDLLDAASTEALRQGLMTEDGRAKKVRTFFFKTNQFALGGKMSNKIKAIGEKLNAIKADIETFQFTELLVRPRNNYNICTELSNLERFQDVTIIGRENDKKEIINRLVDYEVKENVLFLPIIGQRGLGKTTLAQFIYHDDEVITISFDLKMWVSVDVTFDIKIIVKKLLESASRKIGEISKLDELKDEFRNAIFGRKYFLVLDNICNLDEKIWSELQNLLTAGARGSRVLITTSRENVAKFMHCREPYYLRGLSDKASWDLFKGDLTLPARERLENLGILDMAWTTVQRCQGIPVIIKMVASSFLYPENWKARWCNFTRKGLLLSPRHLLPRIPQFCYSMLPSHLKYCFTYCSLFPKRYTICKTTLIRLWIAQGFVKSQEDLCLEDIGHKYFINLLRGQFFHEPNFDKFGNIISCKMPNSMHDLATSMAGPLITMLEKRKITKKTRHVGFINFALAMPSMLNRGRFIRTFFHSNLSNFERECDCETIFSNFKLLRVLDLNYQDLTQVPSSICELKHLRYLDLSNNKEIVKLPKSITSLLNLHTIKLSGCWSLKELPRDIKRLVNLRHLELDDCWELRNMPCGLGQLINLQTLTLFVVNSSSPSKHCAGLNEINRLNNLRGKLVIRDSHAKGVVSKHQAANLREKLTSLYLRSCARGDLQNYDDNKSLESFQPKPNGKQLLVEDYWDLKFSSWILSLTGLVELKLLRCKKCQCLTLLGQLRSLKCLWLEMMDAMQYISECSDQNEFSSSSSTRVEIFSALETIHLSNCPKLMGWLRDSSIEVSGGSHISEHHLLPFFPCLSSLHVSECPLLTLMPLSQLCSLKCLWLEKMDAIQYIFECSDQNELSYSLSTPVKICPALETIYISNCPKLMGWQRDSSMEVNGGSHSSKHHPLPLFPYLSSLHVSKCPLLTSMPLSLLHSLKCLWLEDMDAIQYLSECGDQNEISSSSSTPLEIFPALETIHVSDCPKLVGWWRDSSVEVGGGSHILEHHLLPFFPRLSSLHISKCPHLISMPRFPYLEELYLEDASWEPFLLEDASWEPFLQTMTTSASSFAPLSKTRTMTLVSMMDVTTMLEDWLQKLTPLSLSLKHCDDLRYLSVNHCDKLKSLTVEHCDKLEHLTVENCDKLESLMIKHSHMLTFLDVRHLTALDKLVLSDCYTLWSLEIRNCENLTAMPECNSLEVLQIFKCPKLTSLPRSMPWVNYLYILECPTLMERCKEVEGEDWPKIEHIQHRTIK